VASRLRDAAQLRIPNLRRQDNMAQMSADAWAALADVDAGTPLVLAGFSMGGYVAIRMLADAPRHVQALALVDTACRPETAENVANREKTIADLQRDFDATALAILKLGAHADNQSNQALLDAGLQIMHSVGAAAAVRQVRAIIGRADHRDLLGRLDMPALVLCGRDDQVTPLALSREAAALIPRAELVIVEQAGHWAPMEQPDAVAAAVRALLARIA
jgi:pimeloyl-ACP methyl ester carboxylesterase